MQTNERRGPVPSCDFPVRVSSSSTAEPQPFRRTKPLVYRPFFISPFFLHARELPPSFSSFSLTQWDNPHPHNLAPPLPLHTHAQIVHTHTHSLCQLLMDMHKCSINTHTLILTSTFFICEYQRCDVPLTFTFCCLFSSVVILNIRSSCSPSCPDF